MKYYEFTILKSDGEQLTVQNLCRDDKSARTWMETQGAIWWGSDFEIRSMTTRPTDTTFAALQLCEIAEELYAREATNNCPNSDLRRYSWTQLCLAAKEILEVLST